MTLGDRLIVMAEGSVQQDDSPMQVYRMPRNRFVAGFIGSPAMNFIDGTIVREGERIVFMENGNGGARMELPRMTLRGGDECATLGVRPEHVSVLRESASVAGGEWLARVRFVEHCGRESVVHAETNAGNAVIGRTSPDESFAVGDLIQLRFDASNVRLFEHGPFGARIVPSDESN